MKKIPSPNFDERVAKIEVLVMHYTDMESAEAAINRLKDPEAKVSAHYVVDEDGTIIEMVEEKNRAWHAGQSFWRGREKVNDFSVGIEIVNPGHNCGYRPFPQIQMEAVAELSYQIITRHNISARNVVAHSDISIGRRPDPGELFDWRFLAGKKIGVWHSVKHRDATPLLKAGDKGAAVKEMQTDLSSYGYKTPINGEFDVDTKQSVIAFQRHFLPFNSAKTRELTGVWTGLEQEIIEDLLAKV